MHVIHRNTLSISRQLKYENAIIPINIIYKTKAKNILVKFKKTLKTIKRLIRARN